MYKFKTIGIILIVLSFVAWGGILTLPIVNLSNGLKVSVGGALAILGEVFFWSGSLLVGKEVVKKFFKKIINKREKPKGENED